MALAPEGFHVFSISRWATGLLNKDKLIQTHHKNILAYVSPTETTEGIELFLPPMRQSPQLARVSSKPAV